jgi:DNA polymerase III subunit delta
MARGLPLVVLVRGEDPSLRLDRVRELIHSFAGDEDLSLGTDDFATEDYEVAAIVDAAQTPPMFTTRRIVVAREVGRFGADDLEPLLAYLAGPIDTTHLVLVGGGGVLSRKLLDAVKKVGEIEDVGVPSGKARQGWLSEQLASAPVRLDARAAQLLSEHLGEDLARLGGIVDVLAAVHGEGARISSDQLEPFLGAKGAGTPWDLTDAIDRGDAAAALSQLHRTLGAGERHPLQVMASLHVHFGRMLRLDGSGARDETDAARLLGMNGSTFPAKKALQQTRKLGSANVKRAITLLAQADVDLRGTKDLSGEAVMELLVARLARLAAARR